MAFFIFDVSSAAFAPASRLALERKPRCRAIWPSATASSSPDNSRSSPSARNCHGSRPGCFNASRRASASNPCCRNSERIAVMRCRRRRITRRWPRCRRRTALVGVRSLSVSGASKVRTPAATMPAFPSSMSSTAQQDAPPCSPKGDVIRKVRVASGDKPAVMVRGGTADRGDMARVDVFAKANKRGRKEFYLVPIYPHQVADRKRWTSPPNKPALIHVPESVWAPLDDSCVFLFSLFSNSLVDVVTSKGEPILGYFRGFDVWGGSINISPQENQQKYAGRPGVRTLREFKKLSVDRLGRTSETQHETRTWHGEACT